ncbi:C6 finger domain protein, putative [Talaromyces stipitatus ATCC 10500]|uniref:C6 finger domain protein, putative n=1 Tax=Talaromyces stipitatus (strain ATCC 10500 / CBS 375.48 / QM 6759 / NRRL 1006) TaxID=441959 RepID=B8MGJ4_TALSN|nr:C6 finger domain protein, putative [Talaromyces stipitatus ATCC 10500]EED16745.1 C6 finger domain protein, putative [Talaromyces stipitatus ATCC 10500]
MKPEKNKVSRITIACNPCRSRKQKKSSILELTLCRPECEQCSSYNRTCEWPEQLKRGPPKGYVEALEQRLHETEDVLLKVLSQLNEAQLTSILSAPNAFPVDDVPQDNGTPNRFPMLHARNRGVEHWKSFPLRDAESIRKWQQDFHRIRSTSSSSLPNENHWRSSRPSRRRSSRKNARVDSGSAENLPNAQSPIDELPSEANGKFQDSNLYSRRTVNGGTSGNRPLRPKMNFHIPAPTNQHESNSSHLSSWNAAPSKEFQEQFMW